VISGFNQNGHDDISVPMREQCGKLLNVKIGRDSWIGNKAVVGNHVGEKSIVGAAGISPPRQMQRKLAQIGDVQRASPGEGKFAVVKQVVHHSLQSDYGLFVAYKRLELREFLL